MRKITYYVPNLDDAYAEWAGRTIMQTYPDAEVTITQSDDGYNHAEGFDTEENPEGNTEFLARLWDRCPWGGL